MHIWHYTDLNIQNPGGVETFIRNTASLLEKAGCTIHIGKKTPSTSKNPQRWILHTHGDCVIQPRQIHGIPNLKSWVHIAHGTSIGRVLACREIFSLSGYRGILKDYICSRFAHHIVCVGSSAQKEIERYFKIPSQTHLIPNGANQSIFQPLQKITSENNLLFIGRSGDRVKNTGRLLLASERVFTHNPSFKLCIAPGIPTAEQKPFVQNLGPCSSEKIYEYFKKSKALILPSLYEGDSLALREAQAAGIPILASQIPAIQETLKNYKNVLFFDPRNLVDIERQITKMLSMSWQPSPILRSWNQVVQDYLKLYETL